VSLHQVDQRLDAVKEGPPRGDPPWRRSGGEESWSFMVSRLLLETNWTPQHVTRFMGPWAGDAVQRAVQMRFRQATALDGAWVRVRVRILVCHLRRPSNPSQVASMLCSRPQKEGVLEVKTAHPAARRVGFHHVSQSHIRAIPMAQLFH
jgi:hypothetical protein